jgi:hypothetical protein
MIKDFNKNRIIKIKLKNELKMIYILNYKKILKL